MTVGDEACDQIDEEVDGTAMARMLNLRDVFELIGDGFDDGPFAQEELVGPIEQAVVHLLAQFGDELESLGDQQVLREGQREIAFITNELAHEPFGELGNRVPIINVAWRQAKGHELALIVDDQVQFEAIEPAHRGFPTSSTSRKDAMGVDTGVMTDRQRSRVDEADAATLAHAGVQIGYHRHQYGGHQLDTALIAHQCWKLAVQMTVDVLEVVGFEVAIVRLVEQDQDGHDFAGMELGRADTVSLS